MKTIVAGGRNVADYSTVADAIADSGFAIAEIFSGGARGADDHGESWARENGVRVRRFPADWKKFGRSAGAIRNAEMAREADALILVWDGESAGSANMLGAAKKYGLLIFSVVVVAPGEQKKMF